MRAAIRELRQQTNSKQIKMSGSSSKDIRQTTCSAHHSGCLWLFEVRWSRLLLRREHTKKWRPAYRKTWIPAERFEIRGLTNNGRDTASPFSLAISRDIVSYWHVCYFVTCPLSSDMCKIEYVQCWQRRINWRSCWFSSIAELTNENQAEDILRIQYRPTDWDQNTDSVRSTISMRWNGRH